MLGDSFHLNKVRHHIEVYFRNQKGEEQRTFHTQVFLWHYSPYLSLVFLCIDVYYLHTAAPNIMVEWLTLLLRIRKASGSILGPATVYPDWGFSWHSSVPPGKCRDSNLNRPRPLPSKSFAIHHLLILLLTLYNLVTEKASLKNYQQLAAW
jgi:hypothetical protein